MRAIRKAANCPKRVVYAICSTVGAKFTTMMNPGANTTTRSQAARTRNEQGDHWSLALPNQLKDMMQVGCATWPTMLV